MSDQPMVSVIMPVYNAEEYLRECLDSVAGQTLKDIEIICVDDGSKDSSLEILHSYEEKDGRFHILTQQNQYAGVARNNGLRTAQGKYVLFLDSDDFFEPTMLETAVARAEECSAQVTLFGAWRYHLDTGKDENMTWMLREDLVPLVQPFSARDVASRIFQLTSPAPWNKLFLRSYVQSLDLQFQALSNSNDLFFTLSALAEAESIAYTTEQFVHYRVGQSTNLQSTRNKNPMNFYHAILGWKERLIERGLIDTFRKSYLTAADDNCQYNLHAISTEALDQEQRKKIVYDLCEDLPAPSEQPEISIIVPVYNVEKYLRQCLDSLSAQTLHNIEILCVNDGSKDGSLAILEEYAARDERIRVIDKKENEGLLLARKSGVLEARGRYIIFVDSDDELAHDACEVMAREMEKDPTDIIQFNIDVDDQTPLIGAADWHERSFRPTRELQKREDIIKSFFIDRTNVTPMYSKVYTRELCTAAYSKIPDFYCYVGEDIFSMFYLSLYANTWRGVPTYKAYKYMYGNGVMNTDAVSLDKFRNNCRMSECVNTAQKFLRQHVSDPFASEALNAMAKRMMTDCLRLLKNRIEEENLPEAAKSLKNSWSSCPVYADTVKEVLGLSVKEFEDKYLDVPVFTQLGSAWEGSEAQPKVTVVVPVYNVQDYLQECLDSLVNQTLRDIEIICVNDGSTDNSLEIVREYAGRDGRVSVISQLNAGPSAARNRGLEIARGEYVIFIDSDDSLLPDALEKLYRHASEEKLDILYYGADSVFEDAEMKNAHKDYWSYYHRQKSNGTISGEEAMRHFSDDAFYRASVPLSFFSRAFLKENELRFCEGIIHEDELFTPLALSKAQRVAVTDENFYRRRVRTDSIMTQSASIKRYNGQFTAAVRLMAASVSCDTDYAGRFLFARAGFMYDAAKETYVELSDWEKKNVLMDTSQEIRFLFNELSYASNLTDMKEAALIRASATYRVGTMVLWLPNKIAKGIQCLKEHGIRYTFRRVLFHLGIRI